MNRLSRELSALRLAQQLTANQQQQQNGGSPASGTGTGVNGDGTQSPTLLRLPNPVAPSSEDMLEAMRRENEHLRNRLVDTEREFIRITRLNEIYREELIQHRRRVCIRPHYVYVLLLTFFRGAVYAPYIVRSPRRQPHRFISPRSILPADASTVILKCVFALYIHLATAARRRWRPTCSACLAERSDSSTTLAGPSAPSKRRVRIDHAAIPLSIVRIGLSIPLPISIHTPGKLRNSSDHTAIIYVGTPRRSIDHGRTPTTLVSLRTTPVPLVVVRGS